MIRPRRDPDRAAVLAMARELAADGTTYVFAPDVSDEELLAYWWRDEGTLLIAERDGEAAGMALLRANQPGRGAHVATAAFAVAEAHRGRGLGRALADAALDEARRQGFAAMQFNFVVQTNPAVALWQQLGFETVGRLPGAFDHPTEGRVDALVMYRAL